MRRLSGRVEQESSWPGLLPLLMVEAVLRWPEFAARVAGPDAAAERFAASKPDLRLVLLAGASGLLSFRSIKDGFTPAVASLAGPIE